MAFTKNYIKYLFVIIFIGLASKVYSENIVIIKELDSLQNLVAANKILYNRNIDSAFEEIDYLLYNCILLKDTVSELDLLKRKCQYYYSKNDVEKLFEVAGQFNKKSIAYSKLSPQAISHIYLAEAYSFTELFNKSLDELNKALLIMKNGESTLDNLLIKVNILTSFANVYMQENKPQESINNLKQADELIRKISDKKRIQDFQHVNYSNMGQIFLLINIDSAKYYATLSIQSQPASDQGSKIMASNYLTIGRCLELKHEYSKAYVQYMKSFEIIKDNGEELNSKELYHSLINISRKIGDSISEKIFVDLLQKAEMHSLKSKYNSMHKILNMQDENKLHKYLKSKYIIILVILLLVITAFLIFVFLRKKNKDPVIDSETYNTLIKMIKDDDPGFFGVFETAYPNFTKKLISINQTLTRSEIEFCALLKLNLSTKLISQYKFIEIRTVQNKKYRIRKRLNIPETADLYNWFEVI